MSCKDAEKYRNWLGNISSTLLKLYYVYPINSKVKDIWKQIPEHWPEKTSFYDPHNTKNKVEKDTERLLTSILKCVESKGTHIDFNINEEIEAWKHHDKRKVINLFTIRQSVKLIESELHMLCHYSKAKAITVCTKRFQLAFTFQDLKDVKPTKIIHRSEAMRKVACILCKLYHGLHPQDKADFIWETPPNDWPQDLPFENPYKKQNKCDKWDNDRLSKALLYCCEKNKKKIPTTYQKITNALSQNDDKRLIENVVVCTSEEKLKKTLEQLESDNLLEETCKIVQLQCSDVVVSMKNENNGSTSDESLTGNRIEMTPQQSRHFNKERKCLEPGTDERNEESEFDSQVNQNDNLPLPYSMSTAAEKCVSNVTDNAPSINRDLNQETETAVLMKDLLDSVDFSKQFEIDKNFIQSLSNHLFVD